MYLGQTNIKYYGMEEILKKIVFCPNLTKKIFEEYKKHCSLGGATEKTQHSGILGKLILKTIWGRFLSIAL